VTHVFPAIDNAWLRRAHMKPNHDPWVYGLGQPHVVCVRDCSLLMRSLKVKRLLGRLPTVTMRHSAVDLPRGKTKSGRHGTGTVPILKCVRRLGWAAGDYATLSGAGKYEGFTKRVVKRRRMNV
jgi:hypothetical protein